MKFNPILITDSERAISARYEIERCMLDWQDWQLVFENLDVAKLDRSSFEFSVDWGKLVFSWWDENRAQSWRILEYETAPGEVRFLATRGIGARREFFRLLNPALPRGIGIEGKTDLPAARITYRRFLRDLLEHHYQDLKVERSTGGRALTGEGLTLPGRYARFITRIKGETALVIGVHSGEPKQMIDDIVAAGIVWLRGYNLNPGRRQADRLIFCLPVKKSRTALDRLALIEASRAEARLEAVEIDENASTLMPVRPMNQYELLNAHHRDLEWSAGNHTDNPWHQRLIELAPDLIESRIRPFSRNISYLINGLEFASVGGSSYQECRFGVAGEAASGRSILSPRNYHRLEALVKEILTYRSADSPDHRHSYFRLRTEAWLEARIRCELRRIDPSLDDRFVYSQIPAWQGDDRSVIDLLTATLDGRLAVLEIKTSEDMHLPLQGLDYWLRIEQARARNELQRRKLFEGIELDDRSPLLFLVAPNLRFHRSFRLVAGCLSRSIEAYRIGISSGWRERICVQSRVRVNGE